MANTVLRCFTWGFGQEAEIWCLPQAGRLEAETESEKQVSTHFFGDPLPPRMLREYCAGGSS